MAPELAEIYLNKETLSTIERAKLYIPHILMLCKEIERLENNINRLEKINSTANDRYTIDKIVDILTQHGYILSLPSAE